MSKHFIKPLAASLLLAFGTAQAATIQIQNRDPVGVGFNDATPVAPVGGNPGTTLGEQRWNVYRYVADIWEKQLNSDVVITVSAGWEPLTCSATSAVLGSASAWNIWRDFAGAPKANTWYPQALANKISGVNQSEGQPDDGSGYGNVDIKTQFNINLGKSDCLAGSGFYLGLDGNTGGQINFVATLLHELGHGLGFATFTRGNTGALLAGFPSAWDHFLLDNVTGKKWTQMTAAERVTSATNGRRLVWSGAEVGAKVPEVLALGTPSAKITAPSSLTRALAIGTAGFGPQINAAGLSAEVMPVVDQTDGVTGLACDPLSAANKLAVAGKIALVDRGVCPFTQKVKNAQLAGAKAVLVVDNANDNPPPGLGGADDTITIPSARISKVDGLALKDAMKARTRTRSGLYITLGLDMSQYAGADLLGRPYLYTPNPFASGSSVSHYDTSAFPNQLMEPFISADLTTILQSPKDLTFHLLRDIGW